MLSRGQDPIEALEGEPHAIDAGRNGLPGRIGPVPVKAMRTGLWLVRFAVAAGQRRGLSQDPDDVVGSVDDRHLDGVVASHLETGAIVAVPTGLEPSGADNRSLVTHVLCHDDRRRGGRQQDRHRQSGDQGGRSTVLGQIPEPVVALAPVPPDASALSSPSTTATGSPSAACRTSLFIGCVFWIPTTWPMIGAHSLPSVGSNMTTLVGNGVVVLPTGPTLYWPCLSWPAEDAARPGVAVPLSTATLVCPG